MLCNTTSCAALSIHPQKIRDVPTPPPPELYSRCDAMDHLRLTSAATLCTIISSKPSISNAAVGGTSGLAAKLSQRDPAQLKNSVFNIPPSAQVYPEFLRGKFDVTMKYRGFIFPSTTIPKEKIVANVAIPGFQKLSIAQVGDVGKEVTNYQMNIDQLTGLDDRKTSISTSINAHLGYDAVKEVLYDAKENANRISIDFIPQRTRNAQIGLNCFVMQENQNWYQQNHRHRAKPTLFVQSIFDKLHLDYHKNLAWHDKLWAIMLTFGHGRRGLINQQ